MVELTTKLFWHYFNGSTRFLVAINTMCVNKSVLETQRQGNIIH